ncbi:MinD/ParA family ATP-binding protein [Nesterenkonia salmonea]|nr:MinD/ParA family protein [Nesterenkonia salmonea]
MTQPPSTPGNDNPTMSVEILSAQQVRIDGEVSEMSQGEDPYARIFEAAQKIALEEGAPVTVHGTDHIRAEKSTFTVTSDGKTEPIGSPGEQGRRPLEAENTPTGSLEGLSRIERRRLSEAGHPSFVTPPPEKPARGMRKWLYTFSAGTINIGPSEKERKHQDLVERIARPLNGSRNTAVLSLKGGIGKTSTTVGVGMTMAQHRGDIPCAIDANPDSGDLAERALGERHLLATPRRNISDLLDDLPEVNSLTKLQTYLHQADRLHVLAGEQDPVLSDSLTAEEWERIHTEFAKYYPVILTDCGTGVSHNAMKGILKTADNLVIAAGFAVSGAQRARQTLTWLASHGYKDLARNAIVVVTDKENVSERVDKSLIRSNLRGMCRGLVVVPFDQSVVDGDQVNLEMLHSGTRQAYMEIAAAIVDGYE